MSDGDFDVVVIGAGLAGLRAATDLVATGLNAVVLEARDRVGGRAFSRDLDHEQWCERGAEFVDADHTHVLSLVEALGLTLLDVPRRLESARWVDMGGRATALSLHSSLVGEMARWHDALAILADQIDPDDPTVGDAAARLDALALADLVASLGLSVMARVVIGREVRTEYMVGPSEVSQLSVGWTVARQIKSGRFPAGLTAREAFRIDGGTDQLARGLAAALGDRVRLNAAVEMVDANVGAVVLASGERIVADHLVAAVPLPVLGRMWPEMPTELAQVGYGIGGKISVQFERRVWNDYGSCGSVVSERAWGELWDTSENQAGDSGILTALLSSNDGAALVAVPDTAGRVLDEIERLFPGSRGLAGERVQTDWTNDRFSLGCYASFGPGQLLRAWPTLRARHGRMLLAGEHTDSYSGFMEGALRSGARVAAEIVGIGQ